MSRIAYLKPALLITALVLTGCGGRNSHAESASQTQPEDEMARGLAESINNELPLIGRAATLNEWKQSHENYLVDDYAPGDAEFGTWCVRARLETPLDGGRLRVRTAYFYLPPVPTPPVLPERLPASGLTGECRLGLVWFQIQNAGRSRSETLQRQVRESLINRLGSGDSNADLHWFGSAYWRNSVLWKSGGVSIVSAVLDPLPSASRSSVSTGMFVAALGAASDLDFEHFRSDDQLEIAQRRRIGPRIDEARKVAALGREVDDAIATARNLVFAERDPNVAPKDRDHTPIYAAIVQWLSASRSLSAPRRAAALFVADQLLSEDDVPPWDLDESPPVRKQLEAEGAVFQWRELAGNYVYINTWLKEALKLDPEGRAGELSFLTLMEMGFETSGACTDQGGTGFNAVIREGEAYLQRKPASGFRADVHFLLGQAYGDIVVLANGGGYSAEEERAQYKDKAPSAREKAIDHYRTAFQSAPGSSRISESWPEAWRLLAGIPPARTYFYCVYD